LTKENGLGFITISKTGRSEFMPRFLKTLCGGRYFYGIAKLHMAGLCDHYIKIKLCNKSDGFKWALVAVYGLAQPDHKENFLAKLVQMGSQKNLPFLMGGDFNILRHPSEKNNSNYNAMWPFLFNAVIDGLNLQELEMMRRNFTWANNLASPTFEKLDHILITTIWEEKFLYPLLEL
jgi:hypothetical protein